MSFLCLNSPQQYLWEKEGSVPPLKMTQDSALIFPFLNKSDSGTYGCTATSNMGSYKAYYTLNVNGEPSAAHSPPPTPPQTPALWDAGLSISGEHPSRAVGPQATPGLRPWLQGLLSTCNKEKSMEWWPPLPLLGSGDSRDTILQTSCSPGNRDIDSGNFAGCTVG